MFSIIWPIIRLLRLVSLTLEDYLFPCTYARATSLTRAYTSRLKTNTVFMYLSFPDRADARTMMLAMTLAHYAYA
jgi:hypothetical protein